MKQIEAVLELSPRDALAHFLRAEILADQNKNDAALRDVLAVLAEQPANPKARKLAGKILIRIPKCKEAVEMLEPLEQGNGGADGSNGSSGSSGAGAPDSETLFLLRALTNARGNKKRRKWPHSRNLQRTTAPRRKTDAGQAPGAASQRTRTEE